MPDPNTPDAPSGTEPQTPAPPAPPQTPAPPVDPPAPPATPKMYDEDYVQGLRSEAAGNRIKARDAETALETARTEHQTALTAADGRATDAETRASAAEQRVVQLEAALQAELDRRLADVPEEKRTVVKGASPEERLAHLEELRAAGFLAGPAPNPRMPAPRIVQPVEGPKTLTEWAGMPPKAAQSWQAENPDAYQKLVAEDRKARGH
jgi:hypothetical protein